MASGGNNDNDPDQEVPEDSRADVRSIQSYYLRCPSPSRSTVISETESIFLEPIHLSSAVAAKKIIREELKPRAVKVRPVPESMLESARQLMFEDLYIRVKDMLDDTSSYNTPCLLDIQRALVQDRLEAPFNPVDEVWPNIFIAEKTVALNKSRLKRMGITHILNAAHATGVYTSKDFYKHMKIRYHGVEVDDFPYVDISLHFRKAAEFLDEALLTHQGKVLVNSVMGISRSAVLVAAYLMIFHHMTIMEALLVLRKKRPICPNEGFLKQLRQLNEALLQERDGDERSDNLSQGSAIEAHTHQEEEQSVLGTEVHSIAVEEENYGKSEMSSVAPITQRCALTEQNQQREDEAPNLPNEQKVDVVNECMVREWQQKNERYQGEDWCQAKLPREDKDTLLAGSDHLPGNLESVRSVDVQTLKEKLWARGTWRYPQEDSTSTMGSSYADMGKQRLVETEKEPANQYRSRHQDEGNMTRAMYQQVDDGSLSETRPLYRSCLKNKDTLTPLEWRHVRRIQFGWNEDTDIMKTHITDWDTKVPGLEDVDLTAYQAWKLKQQKKMGAQNKDEIVDLSRDRDSASAKRKEHHENILEHSHRSLEEGQSTSGWDTESLLSIGSVPVSTAWSKVSNRSASDNATSLLSMQSSCSSLSQIHSELGQSDPPMIPSQTAPQVLIEPTALLPDTQKPEVVNLTSIQNLISNVVTENLFQKQDEAMKMEENVPPNMLSCGENTVDEGKTSIQSEASYLSSLSQSRPESVLSAHATSSFSSKGAYKGKITDTSVPLCSLFQDQVDKLDAVDKEIKFEMRGKITTYEMQKTATDNKRSTLFNKKPKEESNEDDEDHSVEMSSKHNPTQTPTHSTHPECRNAKGTKPQNSSYFPFEEQVTEGTFAREQEEHERISRFYPRAVSERSASNQFQAGGTNVESHQDPCSELPHHSKLPPVEDFLSNSLAESKSRRMWRSYTTDVEEKEEEELQDYTVKRKVRH
ncbi:serine/threonine/tyrosine-interacting-like protein 2 [Conger conger]|uniref:serine/threonine/tyrosine-interacting-like protein 2 n=1 Tax=Conger conger TaxID=82655 RepID=UPI002A5B0392|nr:serine/threonine/tyrosine-interacting-like protein 2 [Conger conger]